MSAILGTLFILGGSAKLCCFCCFACRRGPPGGTNPVQTPRTFPRLHNDHELGPNSSIPLPPGLPSPRSRVRLHFLHTHFLTKEKLRPDKKREQPQMESPAPPGTLARGPRLLRAQSRPRRRAALPAGRPPTPPTSPARGPCSPPRRHQGG